MNDVILLEAEGWLKVIYVSLNHVIDPFGGIVGGNWTKDLLFCRWPLQHTAALLLHVSFTETAVSLIHISLHFLSHCLLEVDSHISAWAPRAQLTAA